jgi:pyruvate dehydrogenase E2 component (dihydrolipoamide acetyltransferase)
MAEFTLPELGENVTTGDVLRVLVKPGDALAKDQPVLEIETEKATIEVPSSVAGRVSAVSVKPGDKVKVGQVVLTVDDGNGQPAGQPPPPHAAAPAETPKTEPKSSEPRSGGAARPASTPTPPVEAASSASGGGKRVEREEQEPAKEGPPKPRGAGVSDDRKVVDISRGARAVAEPAAKSDLPPAPAAPSVRRMARELGVDINEVGGTQAGGRISIDDVKNYAKQLIDRKAASTSGEAAEPLPDFSRWGDIERQPMRAVRRATARHIASAWRTVPHVTQHDLADITELDALRKRYAKQAEAAGGALTVTAIAVKVCAAALRKFPQFNASVDMEAEEIVYKKYVNVGVAVDTDRGLLVPVIRDADRKNITEISVELSQLAEKARSKKIALEEMQGGTFSVSNLGGIGGSFFTPIVNAPEVAILGISRARTEPVHHEAIFVPRLMLPLSLSYDHRIIDGADGIRFLRWVVEALEQPFLLALQG